MSEKNISITLEKVKKTYNKAIVCGVFEYWIEGKGWIRVDHDASESETVNYISSMIQLGVTHFCIKVRHTFERSRATQVFTSDFSANELIKK